MEYWNRMLEYRDNEILNLTHRAINIFLRYL